MDAIGQAGATAAVGIGATLAMDAWMVARKRLLGMPPADYGQVGRWLGHMPRGRFVHERITSAAPVAGERAVGWIAHYATGIAFAGLLIWLAGTDWLHRPTLAPALLLGLATVAAPFLLMQPGMGHGIAARRAPRPSAARLQSLLTHAIFGLGLYGSGLLVRPFIH